MVAPDTVTAPGLVPVGVAVTTAPAQVVLVFAVAATRTATGKVSVNPAPVIAVEFGLVSTMVSVETPFTAMAGGANDFVAVGGFKTVNVAVVATWFDPPLVLVIPPTGMVFGKLPAEGELTLTVTVQELLAGSVMPVTDNVLIPFTAVITASGQVEPGVGIAALTSVPG